jgi:hypothetical protein
MDKMIFKELIGHKIEGLFLSKNRNFIIFEVSTGHVKYFLYECGGEGFSELDEGNFSHVHHVKGLGFLTRQIALAAFKEKFKRRKKYNSFIFKIKTETGVCKIEIGNNDRNYTFSGEIKFWGNTAIENDCIAFRGSKIEFFEVKEDF